MPPDAATTVAALLAAAGIEPDEDEVEVLVTGYPDLRAATDRLHAVEGLADVAPLPVFSLAGYAP